VDHNGVDRLDELVSEDGNVFSASGPGYLVVTFPPIEGEGFGLVTSAPKKPPFEIEKRAPDANPVLSEFTVAFLDENGGWNETANIPPRETPTQEVVLFERETGTDRQTVTVRISWTDGYTTDAVSWFVPSDERPAVQRWTIQRTDLSPDKPANRQWSGFGGKQSLILTKGDVFEFSFACAPLMESAMKRDYVVRARGRYGRNLGDIAGAVPGQFQLHANHPNPFNAATTITYELAAARHVKLNIYNVLGQHVATLVNARQEAGRYTVVWDGKHDSGLPAASGLYLTRMIAGDQVFSRKMIMLK
jgi:hypothetical protein